MVLIRNDNQDRSIVQMKGGLPQAPPTSGEARPQAHNEAAERDSGQTTKNYSLELFLINCLDMEERHSGSHHEGLTSTGHSSGYHTRLVRP